MKKKTHSVVGSVLAAVLALGVSGVVMPAASAGTGACTSGYGCIWKDTSYNGLSFGTYNGGGVADKLNDQGSSAAANGKTCKYTRYYDGHSIAGSTSYFMLYSKQLLKSNYRDPKLSNGAGTGPGKSQNWDNRVSSIFHSGC
ncbi:peptidase inhibitor family I36 protein [Ancrocorticia populi]|uniref:peptidase inhibitor family I36 protein n=1 Tax=Ancrocorticia populi TaxID=2175228 RepID=UPI00268EA788